MKDRSFLGLTKEDLQEELAQSAHYQEIRKECWEAESCLRTLLSDRQQVTLEDLIGSYRDRELIACQIAAGLGMWLMYRIVSRDK